MTKKSKIAPGKSQYDPTRDTVGKIYRDLQMNSNPGLIEVGSMTDEMLPGLVADINEAIKQGTKDFEGQPFYIQIHEKRDMQMQNALLRRVIKRTMRPYPEDDTTVFWHDPKAIETRFCWCLPHWSEMYNMLKCPDLFDHDLIEQLKAWRRVDLHYFGFMKDDMGNWTANPNYKDKPLKESQTSSCRLVM